MNTKLQMSVMSVWEIWHLNENGCCTGQGRLDGAFCDFTENDKMEYLSKLHDFGVINIEMECTIFAALTYHAGIRSAIVCVALLDRLKGDQVWWYTWEKKREIKINDLIPSSVTG